MSPSCPSSDSHTSVDIPAWSHVEEEQNVKNLIESVWMGSNQFRNILFAFVTVVIAIPMTYVVLVRPDPPDLGVSPAFLILYVLPTAGVLYCLVSSYVAVIPPPAGPPAHGALQKDTDPAMRLAVHKIILIANPVSGKQATAKIVNTKVLPRFAAAKVDVQYHLTTHKGHGYELAASLDFTSYDGLVVVGGDGTAHEVINGMMARKDKRQLAIGIIPAGTGNSMMMDFQAVSDMCQDVDTAVDVVLKGLAPHIDLNHVVFGPHPVHQQAYSSNLVGYTVDQCLSAINIDDWNGLLGNARYDICALWGILKNRHAPVSIWMDGQLLSADVTVLAVNHTQHMGRGLRGCPNARWDDAVLDIMYINRTTRAKLVRMFNGVKTGGACRFPTDEGLFNIDGQVCRFQGGKITIQCKPRAIRFFAPH